MIILYGVPGCDDMEVTIQDAVDLAWHNTDDDLLVVEEWSLNTDEGLWSREAIWKVPTDPDEDGPPFARYIHRTEV